MRARCGAAGPYLAGTFSIADVMYAPVAIRFIQYDPELTSLSAFPVAQQYIRDLDAVQEWIAGAARALGSRPMSSHRTLMIQMTLIHSRNFVR